MKIAIISDIHANFAALQSFEERFDELWVVGDLVNFKPQPGKVVDWVRDNAQCVVRGNHDHAVGYGVDPRWIPAYSAMASETALYCAAVLTDSQRQYLRLLPLTAGRTLAGTRFQLCHATPSDPLFGYLDRSAWAAHTRLVRDDALIVGHTHEPAVMELGKVSVVNPRSLAGLRVTSPDASYAIWDDGRFHLKQYSYPVEETIGEVERMPISQPVRDQLCSLITTGDLSSKEFKNARN